jgi:ketosteroid isomerase-like protein
MWCRLEAEMTQIRLAVMITLVGAFLAHASAADHASDEAAIRALIAKLDAGKTVSRTTDHVFWSGAYETPVIGNEQPRPRKGDGAIDNRVPGSQRSKTTIWQLIISDGGDMAYDYSDATLTFDLKTGEHRSLTNSTIRVWKKEGGQWKLAVSFSAPHRE